MANLKKYCLIKSDLVLESFHITFLKDIKKTLAACNKTQNVCGNPVPLIASFRQTSLFLIIYYLFNPVLRLPDSLMTLNS